MILLPQVANTDLSFRLCKQVALILALLVSVPYKEIFTELCFQLEPILTDNPNFRNGTARYSLPLITVFNREILTRRLRKARSATQDVTV